MQTVLVLLFTIFLAGLSLSMKAQNEVSVKSGGEKTIVVRDGLPAKGEPIYGSNYFRNKAPFTIDDSSVLFVLRGHRNAKTVVLSGTFSNWSPTALLMTKTDSGWMIKVNLPAGRYEYKFIIDEFWDIDHDNLLSVSDASGNINSIYYKTNLHFTVPSFYKAKNVYLAGSFNNWRDNELKMLKTSKGWELSLYIDKGIYRYKFIIEDKIDATLIESPYSKKSINTSSAQYGYNLDLTKDISFYEKSISAKEKAGNKKGAIDDLVNIAISYANTGDHTKALEHFQKAEDIAEQYNPANLTSVWSNMATLYGELFDIPNQLNYLQKAHLNSEKWGDQNGRAAVLEKLGHCYMNFFIPKAPIYFREALREYEHLGNNREVAVVSGSLGYAYLLLSDTSNALSYIQKSLSLNQEMDNQIGLATNYWVLGDYYARKFSTQALAIQYLQRSLEIFEAHDNKMGIAEVLSVFPKVYLNAPDSILKKIGIEPSRKWDKAISVQKKSLELYRQLRDFRQLNCLLQISRNYERVGIYDSALIYFRRYVDFVNLVANVEKQKQIARLEWIYDADKKEEYLILQRQISEGLTIRQRQQLELRNKELLLTKQEKDLQTLAFLKSQSDLQNEQLTRQQKEKQLALSEKEKELQSAKVGALEQEKAIAKLSQQRQWIYIIIGILTLALVAVYFIYRWRLSSVRLESQLAQEKSEQQRKDAEFQHKLADISLLALRAQMNPHFIFNSLNSIKSLINKKENDKAANYLTTFSKLIRYLFQNSNKREVSLHEELETCRLYTQLEQMRFGDKVNFIFEIDERLDLKDIKVPALIIQPFIENAIWHGLVPKEVGGKVIISVKQNNGAIECIIDDDGIGRELSAQYKAGYEATHQSRGIGLTQSRLELNKILNEREDSVQVIDKENYNGKSGGTKVILTFKENYG